MPDYTSDLSDMVERGYILFDSKGGGQFASAAPSEAITTSQMIFATARLALCAEDHSGNSESPHRMRS